MAAGAVSPDGLVVNSTIHHEPPLILPRDRYGLVLHDLDGMEDPEASPGGAGHLEACEANKR